MLLLDRIRSFLEGRRGTWSHDRTGQETDLELQAATTILLIEAAYGDTDYVWREHRTILKGLQRDFGLGRSEIVELLGRANEIRPPVVTLADVTGVLRERFTREQRMEVVRLIWRVIEADDVVEEWEEGFADHIARAVGLGADEARAARGQGR